MYTSKQIPEAATMSRFKSLHLKNEMLVANLFANLIGTFFVQVLVYKLEPRMSGEILPAVQWLDITFTPAVFVAATVLTLLYELPIRNFLDARHRQLSLAPELAEKARRRLLNEPFVLIAMDFTMWLLSAILYPLVFWIHGAEPATIKNSVFISLSVGLITAVSAFFLLEHVSQKRLAVHFFPQGRLYSVPGTLRIRIRTRLIALLLACNLIPIISILNMFQRAIDSHSDPAATLAQLHKAIFINGIVFIGVGICLTMLVSRNLSHPFGQIIQALQRVRNGRFDKKVRVTSNDEIGYTGDAINEMTDGLKERDHMRRSLDLAMEVQQHLMPTADPEVEGLDIAGTSIYCDETGGDYYDYLLSGKPGQQKLAVIVGDVSDHGIASALLMATARAFLRQRASQPGNPDDIITDVNRQLCRDVEDSGRFMTLFFCSLDPAEKTIRWINAGHDPASVYDRATAEFEDLGGRNLPLAVDSKAVYNEYQKKIQPGQILLIGTDGIWESQNPQGRMFGKERFKDVIRTHAEAPAKEILKAVIDALDDFRRPLEKNDDVTLVVVKIDLSVSTPSAA
jgi:sigma-B regulation protein RsbU (phosphoserine phosphatase)